MFSICGKRLRSTLCTNISEQSPKIKENEGGKTPPKEVETLEFKNVSFKYEGQEKYALKNVKLMYR